MPGVSDGAGLGRQAAKVLQMHPGRKNNPESGQEEGW